MKDIMMFLHSIFHLFYFLKSIYGAKHQGYQKETDTLLVRFWKVSYSGEMELCANDFETLW